MIFTVELNCVFFKEFKPFKLVADMKREDGDLS